MRWVDALRLHRKVWGRHVPNDRVVQGAYAAQYSAGDEESEFKRTLELVNGFADKNGRRPRLLVAKMGQDGHDRGAKVRATAALQPHTARR